MLNYWDRAWSTFETGEAFAALMLDGDNYERIDELVMKAMAVKGLPPKERVGYLVAWLESYINSEFFETELDAEEITKIDVLELARAIMDDEPLV